MPTYFLNLTADGERLVDETGFEANDQANARRKMVRYATDVLRLIARRDLHTIEGALLDQEHRELIQVTLTFRVKPTATHPPVVSQGHEP